MGAKKLTKKQLKEDSFITTTLTVWEYIREHQNRVFMGLLAIVIVVAVIGWTVHSRKQSQEMAAAQFSEALGAYRSGEVQTAIEIFKLVSERYPNTKDGAYATYFHGKCLLEAGRNSEALETFDAYLRMSTRYPFFHDAALDGKAVSLENERRYIEAADTYLELIDELKTNVFMKKRYLQRAAENLKLGNQKDRAIEVMEELLEMTAGLERRNIEVELELLRG